MRIIQKLKSDENQKILEVTFLIWLILLPFGAKIGSISLGFFSIYPGLVVSFLLFPLAFLSIKKWNNVQRAYLILLIIWLIYACSWPLWNFINSEWKFDIHSLILQLFYGTIIIGMFHQIGKEQFLRLLKKGVFSYLVILIVFGMIEFFTGLHFVGDTTKKLLSRDLIDDVFYIPTFIYDNPNDFIVYLAGLILILVLIQPFNNHWKNLTLFITLFLFSIIANARFGILLSCILILIQIMIIIKSAWKFEKLNYLVIASGIIFNAILILKNPVFIGPRFKEMSSFDIKKATDINLASYEIKAGREPFRNEMDTTMELSSNVVRKNLILNGLEFMKESPLTGIGPGQFRYRHAHNQKLLPTGTIVGPHNYPIELVSQYGWIAFSLFFFLLFVFIKQIQLFRKNNQTFWLLVALPFFCVISLIPSSFLYMDINWLLIPIIIVLTFDSEKKSGIPLKS